MYTLYTLYTGILDIVWCLLCNLLVLTTALFISVYWRDFYSQISFISLSERDLLLRILSDPSLCFPPLSPLSTLSKVSRKCKHGQMFLRAVNSESKAIVNSKGRKIHPEPLSHSIVDTINFSQYQIGNAETFFSYSS